MNIPNITLTASPSSLSHFITNTPSTSTNAHEAETLIQKGIDLHEALELETSTRYFGEAAELGSPLAMYFYGLALKSGWGCTKNMEAAHHWFSKAADTVLKMEDLFPPQPSSSHEDTSSPLTVMDGRKQGEPSSPTPPTQQRPLLNLSMSLVDHPPHQRGMGVTVLGMSLYELAYGYKDGQSALPGWKVLSHFYLSMAAHLGDPHAQLDLATNYLYGIGVKTDRKLAARYFRLASQAGLNVPGNAWIWKSKYDPES
ncbi:hypothetical protein HMI55_002138 [Coelomomyces lativittatus]|nr:hypothetical protein HMI55_002138 [Coelomomyces lativittatus]